jgi:hypothetical protein
MRRPSIRSLAGGAAGIVAGVTTGIVLTAVSAAGPSAIPDAPTVIDAAHVPPLLRLPGEPAQLRYSLACTPRADGRPCAGSGTVYVRYGESGAYRPLPLSRGDDSQAGRYYADVGPGVRTFTYYAVLRDEATGATVTIPSGGAAAPQLSLELQDPITAALGTHEFGRPRPPSANVVTAHWGAGTEQVGLAGSRELGYSGPSSFDVETDGTVDVLDSVNARVSRWRGGRATSIALDKRAVLADFAVEAGGGFDVLDVHGALRRFHPDGTLAWTQMLADRTWAKLDDGSAGSVVLQEPAEQWLPIADHGTPLSRTAQARAAHNGKPLPNGHELLVDRIGVRELRVAEVAGRALLRSWRVTSATPLGEVQLAQPLGSGLVVVAKVYTDDRDEFLVLVLGGDGVADSFSVASDSWTETAPLARFRLAAGALYRLHTTSAGLSVDRFDLEVPR